MGATLLPLTRSRFYFQDSDKGGLQCGLSNKQWRNHPRFRLRRRRRLQLLGLISLRQENPAAPRLAAGRALGPAFRTGERAPGTKTCKMVALSEAPSRSKVTNSPAAPPPSPP